MYHPLVMKRSSKAGRVIKEILRHAALAILVLAFGVVAPLWALADNMVGTLTDQRTYERIIRDAGIGGLLADGLYEVESLLPDSVMGYLQGSEAAQGTLEELNGALGQAVDAALTGVVAQIPAYVAGEKDSIDGAVDLRQFKQQAAVIVAKRVPGGALVQGLVRRGLETSVPDSMSLDRPLMALEALLTPIRLAVDRLLWLVDAAGAAALNILIWIALIAFALSRSVRWCGIALGLAGAAGLLLDGILRWLLGLALPDAVLENHIFEGLLMDAVTGTGSTAAILAWTGGAAFFLSVALPPILRRLGRGSRGGPLGRFIRVARPRGGHATILTPFAVVPALIHCAVGRRPFPRRLVDATLGGYHLAARAFDFALPALIMWSAGVGRGAGVGGTIAAVIASGFLVLFWFLRDRPRTLGGFNFIDKSADLRRGRQPGRRAPAASLIRSLPLVASMSACLVVSPWIAFGAGAAIEAISILALWPDRSLFDLVAGTRARRISR